MKAVHLRTDYLKEPLGLGNRAPEFFWHAEGGMKQTAYQVIVYRDGEEIWNSGKVRSARMTHIRYGGPALKSREVLVWKVILWDEKDQAGEASESFFEMGLLEKSDWTAKWITGDYKPKKKLCYPVDCFKKEFQAELSSGKKLVRARIYATARGVYDLFLNGSRIEEFILAPGMTDYRKRIQYQVYDVTGLIQRDNIWEIRLADGWYRGSVAAYGVTGVFGTQTSVMAQLELTYEDGSKKAIGTDGSFLWCSDGPVRFSDLKDGEVFDASLHPSYHGRAKVTEASAAEIAAADNVPVKEHERLQGTFVVDETGHKVIDFGQNIAGYLEFRVKGKKGQRVDIVCGEVLDAKNQVDLSGVQETIPAKGWTGMKLVKKLLGGELKGDVTVTPKQEIHFTASGDEDVYKTSFAVFGFRYIEIHADFEVKAEDFTAVAVYSDMEQTGEFACSDERVNRLVENTRWSMKGNFLDVPTDCPTRERLGWTGDAQIFFNTGAYLMDTAAFFKKWLRDCEDNQYKNGLLSAVVPYSGVEMMYKATGSSAGWADAIYLVPYRFYKRYGDVGLLKCTYPMMKKYADYLMKNLGLRDKKAGKANPYNDYTYEKGVHLGEWLEPEEFRDAVYGTKAKHPEECTAYLYLTMKTMEEIASLLGETEDSKTYQQYASGAKKAYTGLFVKAGTLDTDRQAKLVRPLALGLLEGEEKNKAEERLLQAVEKYHYKVGTGFLSTPFLLPVLTEAGYTEAAYKMLANEEKPGWLAEIADGATTIWENWEGDLSRNHYSPGAVCEWLFDTAAGIRVDGENSFVIAPHPGGDMTFVKASYQSIYGKVECGWERTENGEYEVSVSIPANTTAKLLLPDGTEEILEAGERETSLL